MNEHVNWYELYYDELHCDEAKIIEVVARVGIDCGDGSIMALRGVLAIGLIEQSKMDDMQDELSDADALKAADEAIKTASLHGRHT